MNLLQKKFVHKNYFSILPIRKGLRKKNFRQLIFFQKVGQTTKTDDEFIFEFMCCGSRKISRKFCVYELPQSSDHRKIIFAMALADLRGRGGRPPGVQIFSISCSFSENLAKISCWRKIGENPGSATG